MPTTGIRMNANYGQEITIESDLQVFFSALMPTKASNIQNTKMNTVQCILILMQTLEVRKNKLDELFGDSITEYNKMIF